MFSLPDGNTIAQLRRGSYPTTISCLAFSTDATFLVTSSAESDTVHIFRLGGRQTKYCGESSLSLVSHARPTTRNKRNSVASALLPASVSGMLDTERDFAHFKLPVTHVESVCAIATSPHVLVATSEGHFYVYSLDVDAGGECPLQRTYRYFGSWIFAAKTECSLAPCSSFLDAVDQAPVGDGGDQRAD